MIIPAFNEADALPEVLDQLTRHNPDHDLVVVDDGSTDDTAVVARAAQLEGDDGGGPRRERDAPVLDELPSEAAAGVNTPRRVWNREC